MEKPKSQGREFTFCDDGGRPSIEQYSATSKFRPGDQVYFCAAGTNTREGPYLVASVPEAGKYTLCDQSKRPVYDGRVVEDRDLELYNPFAPSV